MAVTINKIAELAGVSRGTVDRVLNNRGGVRTEQAEKIKAIASKLSYIPNPVAKALANSKKEVRLSVLINSLGNPFFDEVLKGISRAASEVACYGVKTDIMEYRGYRLSEQVDALNVLLKAPPSGLIITPINDISVGKALNGLFEKGVGIVTLNTDISGVKRLCFIGCNYIKSGEAAAELMGKMTFGEIKTGIITGSNSILGHSQRITGFRNIIAKEFPRISVTAVEEGNDDNETAYRKTKALLEDGRVDALYFCAGGLDGGICAIKEQPRPITVIAVDSVGNVREYINTGLIEAVICQEPYKQGYNSVMTAFEYMINGQHPPNKHYYTKNEILMKYNFK